MPDEKLEDSVGLLVAQGRYQEAQLVLEDQVRAQPRCAHSHFLLASLHQVRGRIPEAICEMRRAVFVDPLNPTYLFCLAALLHQTGHLHEALKFAKEASRRDPENQAAVRMVEELSRQAAVQP